MLGPLKNWDFFWKNLIYLDWSAEIDISQNAILLFRGKTDTNDIVRSACRFSDFFKNSKYFFPSTLVHKTLSEIEAHQSAYAAQ